MVTTLYCVEHPRNSQNGIHSKSNAQCMGTRKVTFCFHKSPNTHLVFGALVEYTHLIYIHVHVCMHVIKYVCFLATPCTGIWVDVFTNSLQKYCTHPFLHAHTVLLTSLTHVSVSWIVCTARG